MTPRYVSPLRYPGGKASLASFLEDVIDLNDLRGCRYFEPYAGGAGAALKLLDKDTVGEIHINDADQRVFAFWNAVLQESEEFAEQLLSVPLTIDEWRRQRAVCSNPEGHSSFEVGFSAFYMNRCNRSGVLTGAGPIGGLEQQGRWKLDARFNREGLAERIREVSKKRQRIFLHCHDAIKFLKSSLPGGSARRKVFVYLDPPYVNNGQRLYLNSYKPGDHAGIARYLGRQKILPWLMSYDDSDLIRGLYQDYRVFTLPIRYSLQVKKSSEELIICPQSMALPRTVQVHGINAAFYHPENLS